MNKMIKRLRVENLETRNMLTAWTNTALPQDVNESGVVEPLDALAVINELNARTYSDSITGELPSERPAGAPFLDVTDSGNVGPLDALQVINALPSTPVDETNVFRISQNATEDLIVGRIVPTGGIQDDSIFEFAKSDINEEDVSDVLMIKSDDHYLGAADAPVVIIEYTDLACPFCGLFYPLTRNALEKFDGQVAIVSRHLPLRTAHPNAVAAAVAVEAAGQQGKLEEMASMMFNERSSTGWDSADDPTLIFRAFATDIGLDIRQYETDRADPDLLARVERDETEAISVLGLQGTPSFIVNDQLANSPSVSQSAVDAFFLAAVNSVESPFKIDRFTGDIRVNDPSLLDFDTQSTYELDVTVNGVVEQITIHLTEE